MVGLDPIARAAFVERLADQVVAEAGDLEANSDWAPVDVAVWDLGPDPAGAEGQLEDLAQAEVPVVVLVPAGTKGQAALHAGSRGVLGRNASPRALRAAIDGVAHGLTVVDPTYVDLATNLATDLAADLAPKPRTPPRKGAGLPVEPLTPREREVLELLATGCSNRQVAEALGMSPHTAKFHVNAILDKLDAQSRTEAVVRAIQLGLVML